LNYAYDRASKVYLADSNPHLVSFFNVVKALPDELIARIGDLTMAPMTATRYYQYRDLFNSEIPVLDQSAILFILNRYGYKGLYRCNKANKYNVPASPDLLAGKPVSIPDYATEIRKISQRLTTRLNCHSYLQSPLVPGALYYLDPPYHKAGQMYTKDKFNQARLASYCRHLDQIGAKFIQSNYDTPVIRRLYESYNMVSISTQTRIRSTKRVELLIHNF